MATAAATVGGASGVVGINLPTFVERTQRRIVLKNIRGVVGINLPTFVERRGCRRSGGARRTVSSGLTSRPSLSVACSRGRERRRAGVVGINLPTFVERGTPRAAKRCPPGVVGINLPTFVERSSTCNARSWEAPRVVGINLPTFVERPARRRVPAVRRGVSSGLTSRPSLSDRAHMAEGCGAGMCRRD